MLFVRISDQVKNYIKTILRLENSSHTNSADRRLIIIMSLSEDSVSVAYVILTIIFLRSKYDYSQAKKNDVTLRN